MALKRRVDQLLAAPEYRLKLFVGHPLLRQRETESIASPAETQEVLVQPAAVNPIFAKGYVVSQNSVVDNLTRSSIALKMSAGFVVPWRWKNLSFVLRFRGFINLQD